MRVSRSYPSTLSDAVESASSRPPEGSRPIHRAANIRDRWPCPNKATSPPRLSARPITWSARSRDLLSGFAVRLHAGPDRPTRNALLDLGRRQALIVAVVPLAKILTDFRRKPTSRHVSTARFIGLESTSANGCPVSMRCRFAACRSLPESAAVPCARCAGPTGSIRFPRAAPARSPFSKASHTVPGYHGKLPPALIEFEHVSVMRGETLALKTSRCGSGSASTSRSGQNGWANPR